MKLHGLKPAESSHQARNRVGRGTPSGNDKTAGRGQKGQKARSGSGVRLGSEGGQTPLSRRSPKRGFTNINRRDYAVVDLGTLDRSEDGTEVTPVVLKEAGIAENEKAEVKVLADSELTRRLTMEAAKFLESAQKAIKTAGDSIKVI